MKISVYITSYNQKHYLPEAIESVLNQTLKPYQLIIIDDYSEDGSQELISAYHARYPKLITPVYHSQNIGIAYTRNEALERVKGDYVTFVDGDDRFLPDKLNKEAKILQNNEQAQIAFSNVYYINEDGERIGIWVESKNPPDGDVFYQTFARDFPVGRLFRSELVNYRAWKQIGLYDPSLLNLYEDYDMRIRLTKSLRTVYCDHPLSEYRLHQGGVSTVKFIQHFKALEYIYHKNKSLLNDLNQPERIYVTRQVKKLIARQAKYAAKEYYQEKQLIKAVKLLFDAKRYDPHVFRWSSLLRALLRHIIY
jgi:glycosyltransferase involved in cell wall biosynthesis